MDIALIWKLQFIIFPNSKGADYAFERFFHQSSHYYARCITGYEEMELAMGLLNMWSTDEKMKKAYQERLEYLKSKR